MTDFISPLIPHTATDSNIPTLLPRQHIFLLNKTTPVLTDSAKVTIIETQITASDGFTTNSMEDSDSGILSNILNKIPSKVTSTAKETELPDKIFGKKISLLRELGSGAYGKVYECMDENQVHMAVKVINIMNSGLPCLMEAAIMASIHHPYLHHATKISCTPKSLYIVSELAKCDLSKYTRLDKQGNLPPIDTLRKWSFQLIQAVHCLHKQRIIHCDIKAANVLYFPDEDVVRLTDFTLATSVFDGAPARRHTICTSTHRALEVLLNKEWSFSADIWSLGCTLYEICYGESLFPYQGMPSSDDNVNPKERNINCILDWVQNNPLERQSTHYTMTAETFHPYRKSKDFLSDKHIAFNKLLMKMLKINPEQRATTSELLKDAFFMTNEQCLITDSSSKNNLKDGLKITPMILIGTPIYQLSSAELDTATRTLKRYVQNSIILDMILDLYCRCAGLKTDQTKPIDDHVKLMTCLWIVSKLMLRSENCGDVSMNKVLNMERLICQHLSFRLLPVPKDEL